MHVTDTLETGGAERVAVNLVNLLPRSEYSTHLCTTRRDGPLLSLVAEDVGRLRLGRRRTTDVGALWRMTRYIQTNEIDILHAHGTSVFIAVMASLFPPYPRVVWHDHYGRYRFDDRPVMVYRAAARRISGVIAVNQPLADWSHEQLHVPADRVWFVPNFVCDTRVQTTVDIPGTPGSRIVCVANFRPEKDHMTLLGAMGIVVRRFPQAHLNLIGAEIDPQYAGAIRSAIQERGLAAHVSMLGQRSDVPDILRLCDIGVLSSASEGFPLALLEYGMAGLASVATSVGQCREVLDSGRAGVVVPAANPAILGRALLDLLESAELRAQFGKRSADER